MTTMPPEHIDNACLNDLVKELAIEEPVRVTRPPLPSLPDLQAHLARIWDLGILTNRGEYHRRLTTALCERLGIEHISLTSNGTSALMVALGALGGQGGEVITTPFTFPATVNVLHWMGYTPVFCDIEPERGGLAPEAIEPLITPQTCGILPVHVFGHPCNMDTIETIAKRHGLWVLSDAAHCFGVKQQGRSILQRGDMSILSFHATKVFSTIEGGAVICPDAATRERVDRLGNFGIVDEETVAEIGINAKMSEVHAAYGLLALGELDAELAGRRAVDEVYRDALAEVDGIEPLTPTESVDHNSAHFPVLVTAEQFGMNRDELCDLLRRFNVHARKYFHPLCSKNPQLSELDSALPENLPNAERFAQSVLCLPMFGTLGIENARRITAIIARLARSV